MAGIDTYTKLMLHCDGADTSTVFTDSSISAHTFTAQDNAQIDTAQYKFGNSCGLFDGTDDYIESDDHTDWNLGGTGGGNNFTIDFWVRFNDKDVYSTLLSTYDSDGWIFERIPNGTFALFDGSWSNINPGLLVNNTWYHVALVRSGTNIKLYLNGLAQGAGYGDKDMNNDGNKIYIGGTPGGDYLNGWMEEVRISKGIARWTTNFTPPTTPYSNEEIVDISNEFNLSELETVDIPNKFNSSKLVIEDIPNKFNTVIERILGVEKLDQNQIISGDDTRVGINQYQAQTFQAGVSGVLSKVTINLHKTGSPTSFTTEIQGVDGGGKPDGNVLATETILASAIPLNVPNEVTITFSNPVAVINGNDYAIVFKSPLDGYYYLRNATSNVYINGSRNTSNNGGSSWILDELSYDFYFKTYIFDPEIDNKFRMSIEEIKDVSNKFYSRKLETVDITQEFRTKKEEEVNINNKSNTAILADLSNINNKINVTLYQLPNVFNNFYFKKKPTYNISNNFRMMKRWQIQGA
ncbi:hypothetical protein LCGC14_1166400 [marine sediment metagenome]|uniref:LamG-like jellyroll fold domain-containing protein n=1 Tax=marine sediment metagenome TaxID=412755 RepID=A0A0F9LW02_9ZZZZ